MFMKRLRSSGLAATWLLLLLQRTPALRLAAAAGEFVTPTRIGSLLKAVFTASASLGAVHSLAGATTLTTTQTSPVSATIGTALQLGFAITGSKSPAASWTVSGSVPPGLTFTGGVTGGTINVANLTLSGTPTAVGSYTFSLRGWEKVNAGPAGSITYSYTINVGGGVTVAAPVITTQPASQAATTGTSVTFTVAANDNWGSSATLQAAFAAAGAFALPAGSNDAAVLVRLPPGGYTVVVSGVGNTTGVALVEVYDLDP